MNDIMNDFGNVSCYQIVIQSDEIGLDEIIIKVSAENNDENFVNELRDHFRAKLRVSPKIEVLDFDVLSKNVFNPNSRKPINFIDLRN
ncbi:hypothetical protein D3C86_2058620 [compost metagenome]